MSIKKRKPQQSGTRKSNTQARELLDQDDVPNLVLPLSRDLKNDSQKSIDHSCRKGEQNTFDHADLSVMVRVCFQSVWAMLGKPGSTLHNLCRIASLYIV